MTGNSETMCSSCEPDGLLWFMAYWTVILVPGCTAASCWAAHFPGDNICSPVLNESCQHFENDFQTHCVSRVASLEILDSPFKVSFLATKMASIFLLLLIFNNLCKCDKSFCCLCLDFYCLFLLFQGFLVLLLLH